MTFLEALAQQTEMGWTPEQVLVAFAAAVNRQAPTRNVPLTPTLREVPDRRGPRPFPAQVREVLTARRKEKAVSTRLKGAA